MDDPVTSGVTEGFGLMFYNARWYDPAIGRFAQADTMIPGGVQGLDRYAYTNNNPIKYVDPTGHTATQGDGGESPAEHCNLDCLRARRAVAQANPITPTPMPPDKSSELYEICNGKAPYRVQYSCYAVISSPAYFQPWALDTAPDSYSDYGPDQWPTDIDGHPFKLNYTVRGMNTLNIVSFVIDTTTFIVTNTPIISYTTKQYVVAIVPYIHNNDTGQNAIKGMIIFNHTGVPIQVTGYAYGGQESKPLNVVIPPGEFGNFEARSFPSSNISFDVYVKSSVLGYTTISYDGPIGVP